MWQRSEETAARVEFGEYNIRWSKCMSAESPLPGNSPSAPEIPRSPITLCRKCGRPIERHFAFCPYCGFGQKGGNAWYYDPVWLAILGLFVIGPFALPLVWRSARLNHTLKLVYTAVLLVYTAVTVYYLFQVIAATLSVFNDLDQVMQL